MLKIINSSIKNFKLIKKCQPFIHNESNQSNFYYKFNHLSKFNFAPKIKKSKILEVENNDQPNQNKNNTEPQVLGNFGIKSKMGGHSQEQLYEKYKNHYNSAIQNLEIPGVTIVKSKKEAKYAVKVLKTLKDRIHAWDTETIDLDIKTESPVGNGKIICASAFCGIDVDFGNGPRLIIDNFAQNYELIQQFKEYLENEKYQKVLHNIAFDRHLFYNHGIDLQGFKGDTMHMMRLLDPSRGPGQYSLASITEFYEQDIRNLKSELLETHQQQNQQRTQLLNKLIKNKDMYQNKSKEELKQLFKEQSLFTFKQIKILEENDKKITEKLIKTKKQKLENQKKGVQLYKNNFTDENFKISMKDLFSQKRALKTGTEGKTVEFPNIIRMHTDPNLVQKWINYSALDAEITFFIYEVLKTKLKECQISFENMTNLFDLYEKYWKPFGLLLTDMERQGFYVNRQHLLDASQQADKDIEKLQKKFKDWACSTQKGIELLNIQSVNQLQQLFFAPYERIKPSNSKNKQIKQETDDGRKVGVRKEEMIFEEVKAIKVLNEDGIIEEGKSKALKQIDMFVKGLQWPILERTSTGLPSVDTPTLKKLVGNPEKNDYGPLYLYYKNDLGKEEEGKRACEAVFALIQLRTVETLKQTFILPLIESLDKNDRIHCSININTETGRLSCRKPNLQNQPAMDKDIYKIREAFIPAKGKKLIVADYGQVELRILAHITNCKNMILAFKEGGDFHSRTAIGMFKHIRDEIEQGKVLLEWDKSKGEAPAPLVKDKYGNERKKAKTMNFSIAYGKTAHGFAKDWDCSIEEAKEALELWYADRIEVKQWQDQQKQIALKTGYSQSLMGRYRNVSELVKKAQNNRYKQHGLRASINTPIQGGAADIVIACMVKVWQNKRLRELGWKLQLQIHDEIILEGPEESAEEALQLVIQLMENPVDEELKIKLEVDASLGDSWYECK